MARSGKLRRRVQVVRGRLKKYEGRLQDLEGRLKVLRGRAEEVTGTARVRFGQAERNLRATMDTALKRLDQTVKDLEPHVRRAFVQAQAIGKGLRAGVKAGAAAYRQSRKSR